MIVMNDRIYHFQCDSPQDMTRWMKGLKQALLMWKKQLRESQRILKDVSVQEMPRKDIKEGYLYELNMFKQWKPYFYILKDGILLSFKNKGDSRTGRIPLYGCKFEEYLDQDGDPEEETSAFKITTPDGKTTILKAGNGWMEMHEWLNTILRQQLVIEEFINSIVH